MSNTSFTFSEKVRHRLYQISILILLIFTVVIFVQSIGNRVGLNFLSTVMDDRTITALVLSAALPFVCGFLALAKLFRRFTDRQLLLISAGIAVLFGALQLLILWNLKAVLRYDHLKIFDGALEIIRTGNLSLTANEQYFGNYPFNISVTIFNSFLLRLLQMIGISEGRLMLALQCCYLAFIDLGILFSWEIIRVLRSAKTAALFAVLCFFNPVLYFCAAGCYTTTLMVPLLMGILLLCIYMLREKNLKKRLFLGVLLGGFVTFSAGLRLTNLIALFALGIYFLIHQRNERTQLGSVKQFCALILAIALGALSVFAASKIIKSSYVSEDYTDSQMPAIYYLMFATNPDTKGTYNEADHQLISSYETLEEKEEAALQILLERLGSLILSDVFSLAEHKLNLTWGDGLEDTQDFVYTSRDYGSLHSFLSEDSGDFYALYCHIYHVAAMGLLLYAVFTALKEKCDSPYYLILVTLLGGIIFHLFWEAYYIYSFGFSMLIYLPASRSIDELSQKKLPPKTLPVLSILALVGVISLLTGNWKSITQTEFDRQEKAVVQNMFTGNLLPLKEGDAITQTFAADRPFDLIGCFVFNEKGTLNQSVYRLELFSEDGTSLAFIDFVGADVPDKNYCYLEVPKQNPAPGTNYIIRIQPLVTTETDYLTFGYYNSHNYDIYTDGHMGGLDSDEKTDLTFTAALRVNDKLSD